MYSPWRNSLCSSMDRRSQIRAARTTWEGHTGYELSKHRVRRNRDVVLPVNTLPGTVLLRAHEFNPHRHANGCGCRTAEPQHLANRFEHGIHGPLVGVRKSIDKHVFRRRRVRWTVTLSTISALNVPLGWRILLAILREYRSTSAGRRSQIEPLLATLIFCRGSPCHLRKPFH